MGNYIYGCDICQDVCHINKGKWQESCDFPNLSELFHFLTPENIMNMEEDFYKERVQPKFFYLSHNELWKWKVNVLCFMRNNYHAYHDDNYSKIDKNVLTVEFIIA